MDVNDLIKKVDYTQGEVLPTTTCECYRRKNKCEKCGRTGIILNPEYPHDRMCKSGHKAKSKRFFKVTGRVLSKDYWGTYCEDCIIIANELARKMKKVR